MKDAQIRKAYSPSGIEQRGISDGSIEDKNTKRITSPPTIKTSTYKIKSRD